MLEKILKKIFGDESEKKLSNYKKEVEIINSHYENMSNFNLEDIKNKTIEFKKNFERFDINNSDDFKKIKEKLDNIKFEAFALVKKACSSLNGQEFELKEGKIFKWNMIPYDVQLIGGLALHDGNISEMKTGEGKTLVATLSAYLNSLAGYPIHIVTVNDYLAKRDSEEMGILYNSLGLSTGVITHNQTYETKKEEYKKDIVYATNNELGFDYLRDNMLKSIEEKVQSPLFYAIIDEVDSILIDEARTPLIISMPENEATSKYLEFSNIAKKLEKDIDYKIDEKGKTSTLSEKGVSKIENILNVENIYVSHHYNDLHHIENALKAHSVYLRDKDYLVNNGEVLIIDEHTGRVLSGRRYSDGLHQAIEAKEGVEIKQESRTLASITFQNYFRMYKKLSGMTGTAKTEEEEFLKVYGLETIVIPTNKEIIRIDNVDLLFKNEKGKFEYVVNKIKEIHTTGQAILVGTVSVDKSEYLSRKLTEVGLKHNVLNAKQHEKEAEIIASAGQKGAITIATNMAGRGTDIKLGEGVKELGGLYIIGTEKHETRRIDNQLRGRSGRQGDPGITQFLVSPNDDIMRIFGGDKIFGTFNLPIFAALADNEPIVQSSMLSSKINSIQKQVEGHNFDIRKHILQYDDVVNKHREIIYRRRNSILENTNIDSYIKDIIINQVERIISINNIDKNLSEGSIKIDKLSEDLNNLLGIQIIKDLDNAKNIKNISKLKEYINKIVLEELDNIGKKLEIIDSFYDIEKKILLQSIDELWMNHINTMSKLKESVALEGYAQKDPLIVYKEKAFHKFEDLIDSIEIKVIKALFRLDKSSQIDDLEIINNLLDNIDNSENDIKSNPLFKNGNLLEKTKIRV